MVPRQCKWFSLAQWELLAKIAAEYGIAVEPGQDESRGPAWYGERCGAVE